MKLLTAIKHKQIKLLKAIRRKRMKLLTVIRRGRSQRSGNLDLFPGKTIAKTCKYIRIKFGI